MRDHFSFCFSSWTELKKKGKVICLKDYNGMARVFLVLISLYVLTINIECSK